MKKDNVKAKEVITFADQVQAINDVVGYCFVDDESLPDTGYLRYCPYFFEAGMTISIVMYFIDGVEFDDGEDVYFSILSDSEIMGLVNSLMTTEYVKYVQDNAEKLLEFRKQEVLNNNATIFETLLRKNNESTMEKTVQDILDAELESTKAETNAYKAAEQLSVEQTKQEEYANQFINQFTPEEYAEITRRADKVDYNMDDVAKAVSDILFNSDKFKDNVVDLDEYKKEKETTNEEAPKKITRKKRTTTKKTTKDTKEDVEVSNDKKE